MSKFRRVDLNGEVFRDADVLRFLAADVLASGAGPLATVYYADNGKKQRYELRLDMVKRVFLDHFEEDPERDRELTCSAEAVASVISVKLTKTTARS